MIIGIAQIRAANFSWVPTLCQTHVGVETPGVDQWNCFIWLTNGHLIQGMCTFIKLSQLTKLANCSKLYQWWVQGDLEDSWFVRGYVLNLVSYGEENSFLSRSINFHPGVAEEKVLLLFILNLPEVDFNQLEVNNEYSLTECHALQVVVWKKRENVLQSSDKICSNSSSGFRPSNSHQILSSTESFQRI